MRHSSYCLQEKQQLPIPSTGLLPAHPASCRTRRENEAQMGRWQTPPRGSWHGQRGIPTQSQQLAGSFAMVLAMQVGAWHGSGALWSHLLFSLEQYQHKAAATRWWFRPSTNDGTGLVTLLHVKRDSARKFTASSILAPCSDLQTPFQTKYICLEWNSVLLKPCQALLIGGVYRKSPALWCWALQHQIKSLHFSSQN